MKPQEVFIQLAILKARSDFQKGIYKNGYDENTVEYSEYQKEHDYLVMERELELNKRDADSQFSDSFLRGQSDCRDGIPHKQGRGDGYNRGYSAQYESEQIMTEMGLQKERLA